MNKKILLKKLVRLFALGKRAAFGKNISVNEAIDIQSAYTSSSCQDDKLPDAPYVEIAKQLASTKDEVFEAALYYLRKIAANESKNKLRIAELLESICKNGEIAEDRKKSVLHTAEKIRG